MGTLVLVRHGQASFMEEDYDKLSALGELQARLLGAYWARHGLRFDAVYVGPRVRHVRTAALAAEASAEAGAPLPPPVALDALDEMHVEPLLRRVLPGLLASDPDVRALHAAGAAEPGGGDPHRNFQRIYELVVGRWVRGELPSAGIESWPAFVARVRDAVGVMRAGDGARGRGRRVAAFTSGGPVAVAMGVALGTDDATTFGLSTVVRNCSVSEFLFSRERFTLSSFNAAPHLASGDQLTYR